MGVKPPSPVLTCVPVGKLLQPQSLLPPLTGASSLVGFVVDWFGYPTTGFAFTCLTLLTGVALCLVRKGSRQANQRQHKTIVGFIIAAAITVIPIVFATVIWVLFVVLVVAFFAAAIGFVVLVVWVLLQAN